MAENTDQESRGASLEAHLERRRLCLDHARDLIASVERVLANDNGYPNVAYHLAILAMEEIGKAGMLAARAIGKSPMDTAWIDRRLDDHVWKLMWAVWSPGLRKTIDPKDFTEARQFAESTHERRMAGLYVDYGFDSASAAPRDAVSISHATSLLNLAKVSLELEATKGEPAPADNAEDLEWFFATISDEIGQKRLFSQASIRKHEELGGDTRAWVRWARDEFAKVAEAEKAHLQRELSRKASEPGQVKPKWLMKVRVRTPSHSLRQKTLNFWNERINSVKLRTAGTKNEDLLLEMTIGDHVKIEQLFNFGLSLSKLHIVMLNIGTGGFFWYEVSEQTEAYYESIQDVDAPQMKLLIGRAGGLARVWSEDRPGGVKRRRAALEDMHLDSAIRALAAFLPIPDKEAEPIFGPYLLGLTFLSKSDIHASFETQARDAFLTTLRRAMLHFGDLDAEGAELVPALHRVTKLVITDEANRNILFASLRNSGKVSTEDALAAKGVADLYLTLVARKLWPGFLKSAADDEPAPQARRAE